VSGMVAVGAAPSAGAWQVQEVDPTTPLGQAYAKRCGGASDHAALVAQLTDQLAKDAFARPLTATCPVCGCPVIVDR